MVKFLSTQVVVNALAQAKRQIGNDIDAAENL